MKKYIHIAIAFLIIFLSFIKFIQNYMIVLIILQALNFIFLSRELRKDRSMFNGDNVKTFNKINTYFFLISLILSMFVFLINKLSSNLSQKSIEFIILIIFIYSILFTIVAGISMDRTKRNIHNIITYLVNALIISLISFFIVQLKTDSFIILLNKSIKDLNIYMILAIIVKMVLDFTIALNINITF